MPAIVMSLVSVLGSTLLSMLVKLVSEDFVKKAVVIGLEKLVKATENEEDNKLLESAKKSWGLE